MHPPIAGKLLITQLFGSNIADKPYDMPNGSGTVRVLGHTGIDIACPVGTPVLAGWPGVVTTTGWDPSGFGNYAVLRTDDGREELFGHLSSFSVAHGTRVSAGQEIAKSGSTGNSTGPHVHVEVKDAQVDVYNGYRGCHDWISALDHQYVDRIDTHLV